MGIIGRLEEPYQTLALLVALTGRRIEEAIGIQPGDLDDQNVLHIRRVIYNGRVEQLEREQELPLDADLAQRIRALGEGHTWVFRSRAGTPVNPCNARRRYLHPAAKAVGVTIGGWHDFRHTLTTRLRKSGVHPKVIAGVLGHKNVTLAPNVYDHCDADEIRSALGVIGKELSRDCHAAAAQ